jgi:hypothetical protein
MAAASSNPAQNTRPSAPFALRAGFWLCILISVAVVMRRLLVLGHPLKSAPPLLAGLDAVFASHALLTLAHILPALAFVLALPVYFFGSGSLSVGAERVLFPLGAVVGISAYAMSAYSVGGWTERSAVLFFNTLFLAALARAWIYMQRGEHDPKRRWLLRAVVILLGIATTRPVMGVFFATASLTHLRPNQFFGVAFWIGFSINAITVELWLRASRRQSPQAGNSPNHVLETVSGKGAS